VSVRSSPSDGETAVANNCANAVFGIAFENQSFIAAVRFAGSVEVDDATTQAVQGNRQLGKLLVCPDGNAGFDREDYIWCAEISNHVITPFSQFVQSHRQDRNNAEHKPHSQEFA
jgi:hypothetical protein